MLLEPNVNILMDKENSELQSLWETGKGRVIYAYKLSPYTDEAGKQGFMFEGDTYIFTPNLKKINKYVEAGQVFIDDYTDVNGPKMFVGLVSNRGITLEKLETLCRQCCYDATTYSLNVSDSSTCFRVPLKDWLHHTYTNYINLLVKVNKRRIAKTEFDIAVNQALPIIADYILNKNPKATDKELVSKLGIPQEVVTSVMGKPISYLRNNKDTVDRVKNLKAKLKELKKFNPKAYAEEIIKRL